MADSKYANTVAESETIDALLRLGYVGTADAVFRNITKELVNVGHFLAETSDLPVWKRLNAEFTEHFFTECIMIKDPAATNTVVLLGPKDARHLTMFRAILRGEGGYMAVTDFAKTSVNSDDLAQLVMRRMPFFCVWQGRVYLLYVGTDMTTDMTQGTITVAILNISLSTLTRVETTNRSPVINMTRYCDGTFDPVTGHFVVVFDNCVTRFDFATSTWLPTHTVTPPAATNYAASGSSLRLGTRLCAFTISQESANQKFMTFELAEDNREWRVYPMSNATNISLRDIHVMRVLGDEIVSIRMQNNSEVLVFNPANNAWRTVKTWGIRPGNYATNPSYIIVGDNENPTLLLVSGQSTSKHRFATEPISRKELEDDFMARLPEILVDFKNLEVNEETYINYFSEKALSTMPQGDSIKEVWKPHIAKISSVIVVCARIPAFGIWSAGNLTQVLVRLHNQIKQVPVISGSTYSMQAEIFYRCMGLSMIRDESRMLAPSQCCNELYSLNLHSVTGISTPTSVPTRSPTLVTFVDVYGRKTRHRRDLVDPEYINSNDEVVMGAYKADQVWLLERRRDIRLSWEEMITMTRLIRYFGGREDFLNDVRINLAERTRYQDCGRGLELIPLLNFKLPTKVKEYFCNSPEWKEWVAGLSEGERIELETTIQEWSR